MQKHFNLRLNNGFFRATLFFAACLSIVFLRSAAFAEDEVLPVSLLVDTNADGAISIAAFGDSITRGVGDYTDPGEYVDSDNLSRPTGEAGYPLRLEQRMGVSVANMGNPGESLTDSGIHRFAGFIPRQTADIVVFDEGTNDAFQRTNSTEYYHAVQAAINITRALGKTMVLTTLPPAVDGHSGQEPWIATYNAGMREIALINNVALADVDHAYRNTCEINNCYLLNLPEGLHPNSAGYDVSAETIMATLFGIDIFAPDGPALLAAALGAAPETIRTQPDPVISSVSREL